MIPAPVIAAITAVAMIAAGIVLVVVALVEWSTDSLWRVPLGIGVAVLGGLMVKGAIAEDDAGYPPRRNHRHK